MQAVKACENTKLTQLKFCCKIQKKWKSWFLKHLKFMATLNLQEFSLAIIDSWFKDVCAKRWWAAVLKRKPQKVSSYGMETGASILSPPVWVVQLCAISEGGKSFLLTQSARNWPCVISRWWVCWFPALCWFHVGWEGVPEQRGRRSRGRDQWRLSVGVGPV